MASGGKKVLKELAAATRRAEREAKKRQRELELRRKEMARAEARQQAEYEVELFENEIDRLLSVHKDEPETWNWKKLSEAADPPPPSDDGPLERAAREALASYQPGFFENLFGGARKKIAELEARIQAGRKNDAINFTAARRRHEEECAQAEAQRAFARRMLEGDTAAYSQALTEINPFEEISELGAAISFPLVESMRISVRVQAKGESVVPPEEKKLTATGKLSSKAMAKGRFYEIYQNYLCGCALRIGRELFALLPIDQALINVVTVGVDSRTGHDSDETLISVIMPRSEFSKLNFKRLTPPASMELFEHRMQFRKTAGPKPVKALAFDQAKPPSPAKEKTSPKPAAEVAETQKSPASNPIAAGLFNALIVSKHAVDGVSLLKISDLAPLLNLTEKGRLTIKESRELAESVESFGCAIEPDARMTQRAYAWTRDVAVFRFEDGSPRDNSPGYGGMATLLTLCVAIAAADGQVDKEELDVFRNCLEGQLALTNLDRKRLIALEKTLIADASAGARAIARVAATVPAAQRPLIGRVLAQVAVAGGHVKKVERAVLEKIYQAFELPVESLDALLEELLPAAPTVAPPDQSGAPDASDRSTEPDTSASFSLDMAKIASIADETKEVVGILSAVLGDAPPADATAANPAPELSDDFVPPPNDDWMDGLDEPLKSPLKKLITRPEWSRGDFNAIAQEFHQMPLNIFDSVNEWSDDSLGDFLLEGENPIEVNRSLIR